MQTRVAPRTGHALKRRSPEIVAAAAKVFAQLGYHGASTQDIADVLGMRQASLYYYFDSKDAALEAVCASGVEDYAIRALQILRATRGQLNAEVLSGGHRTLATHDNSPDVVELRSRSAR